MTLELRQKRVHRRLPIKATTIRHQATSINFVMEQHVGHRTFYQNMRKVVERDHNIKPNWVEVTYREESSPLNQIQMLSDNLRGAFFGTRQVRRGLARSPKDVSFYFTQVPALLGGRIASNAPYVLSTDITPKQFNDWSVAYNHPVSSLPLVERYKHLRNQRCFHAAAKIVAWSDWVADSLMKDYGVPREKIAIIPPGVDLQQWKPLNTEKTGRFNILFVGADFHRKRGDMVIDAFRRLPRDKFQLHIVTRSTVESEPGITVHNNLQPNTPELIRLFQQSDVLVHPSQAEAYGLVAIEAAATGVPAIVSKLGGLQSTVTHGKTGFLVAPDDVDSIYRKLVWLADDRTRQRKMANAARKKAEVKHSAARNIGSILEILQEVAARAHQQAPITRAIPLQS